MSLIQTHCKKSNSAAKMGHSSAMPIYYLLELEFTIYSNLLKLEFMVRYDSYALPTHLALVFWHCGYSLTVTSEPLLFHHGPAGMRCESAGAKPPKDLHSSLIELLYCVETTSETEWNPPPNKLLNKSLLRIPLNSLSHIWTSPAE